MLPAVVGPYVIERELGRGGMGVVLAGRAPDGRAVAVKLLLELEPGAAARFAREARLQASLGESEGFVPLLDAGVTTAGEPYLILPLLTGGTLRDRLRRGPLEVDAAARLVLSLSQALAAAHTRGLVHRDLKPENVLFTADGRPLVADLGLAKHWQAAAPGASRSVALTRSGESHGTPGYMAPEQVEDSKRVGPPADVFALGAILYEALCGASPIQGASPHNRLYRTIQGDFPPLGPRRPDAPAWLVELAHRALAVDPAARPADGAALAALLDAGLAPTRRRRGGTSSIAALLAALAAGAAAATGVVVLHGGGGGEVAPVDTRPAAPVLPAGPASPPVDTPARALGQRFPCAGALRVVDALGSSAGAHDECAAGVCFVPGGATVVTSGEDGEVVVRELASGEVVRRLVGLQGRVTALDASSDGTLVAGADAAGTVVAWELATGRALWSRPGPRDPVRGLAFSRDGQTVLWTGDRRDVRAAAARTGERVTFAADLPVTPGGLAVLPSPGLDVLVCGAERPARVTKTGSGVEVRRAGGDGALDVPDRGVAALEGSEALTLGAGGALTRWRLAPAPVEVERFAAHTAGSCLAASPDGRVWASGGADGVLIVARSADRHSNPAQVLTRDVPVLGVDVDDAGRVLSALGDDLVRLWLHEVRSGALTLRPLWTDPPLHMLTRLTLAEDGGLLVASLRGVTHVDRRGAPRPAFRGHGRQVTGVAPVARDAGGARVVSVGLDGFARLWRLEDGVELARVEVGRPQAPASLAVTADGRRALVGTSEARVLLWDLDGGRLVELPGVSDPVRTVAVSGQRLLATDEQGRLLVWELGAAGPAPPRTLAAHRTPSTVATTRDRVLTAADDGALALWDLGAPDGAPRRLVSAARDGARIHCAALSPDGRRVLVASNDGRLLLWDLEGDGGELGRLDLDALDHWSRAVVWAPDGRSAWVGSVRGVVLQVAVESP